MGLTGHRCLGSQTLRRGLVVSCANVWYSRHLNVLIGFPIRSVGRTLKYGIPDTRLASFVAEGRAGHYRALEEEP
jgi:hypothetical protein